MSGDNRFDEYALVTAKEVGAPLVTGTTTSLRLLGWVSLILSLLWIYGLGSILGAVFGLTGVLSRGRVVVWPAPGLRLCIAGLTLGLIGCLLTLVLYFL